MIDIILITITIIALIIATIVDIKIHEVPDYLTYSLIFTGLAIKLIYSILANDFYYILYALIGLASMYLIGSLFYYTKQWGGGDTKLLIGIGITLTTPKFITSNIPFLVTLFANIIIIGAVYSILIGLTLILIHWKKFILEFMQISKIKFYRNLELILFIISIFPLILIFFIEPKFLLLSLFLLLNLFPILLITFKSIEKVVMYKTRLTKNLVEGDWLINPIEKNNKILVKPRNIGLTKEDIKLLIKNKIEKVLVKEGIPFVPAITLATIFTLIYQKIPFILI